MLITLIYLLRFLISYVVSVSFCQSRPGMNKCSFSQDATTEALHALYKLSPEILPIKYDQDQSEDSDDNIIHRRRALKKKRHVKTHDDSLDGFDQFYPNQLQRSSDQTRGIKCLDGEICKPLKPVSVEGYFTPCFFLVVWVYLRG